MADDLGKNNLDKEDEKKWELKKDLNRLQELAEKYRSTFSQLPKLSQEYDHLQRNIRMNIRKMQLKKKSLQNKSKGA